MHHTLCQYIPVNKQFPISNLYHMMISLILLLSHFMGLEIANVHKSKIFTEYPFANTAFSITEVTQKIISKYIQN